MEPTRMLVTGGAGFLGSHLCDRLIERECDVLCMDNLLTGRAENIGHLLGHPRFRFIQYDVSEYLHVDGPLDAILHFASPASPKDYLEYPIHTLKVGAFGTHKGRWGWSSPRARGFSWRAARRCTGTRWSIRSPRPTGGT